MRRLLVPVAATAFFVAASIANAATATGSIESIDIAKAMITLDNGTAYMVPKSLKLSAFTVGEKVIITYKEANGQMQVSAIKPAPTG